VKKTILFVTGTDTGVGKTVLTAWLARHLRESGRAAIALKPVCSGGREDALALRAAAGNALALDKINPWHFHAPLAPLLAARREGRKPKLAQVLTYIRHVQTTFPIVLVEGAGGLLSPLGEDFDSRDLLVALRATPLVACPNRLGAINQSLVTLAALPPALSRQAKLVLMSPLREGSTSRSNDQYLREKLGPGRVHSVPWSARPDQPERRVRAAITSLANALGV